MTNPRELLHSTEGRLGGQEEHMYAACHLSRALWSMVNYSEFDTRDERDRCALQELANIVAFHASAAVTVMQIEEKKAKASASA